MAQGLALCAPLSKFKKLNLIVNLYCTECQIAAGKDSGILTMNTTLYLFSYAVSDVDHNRLPDKNGHFELYFFSQNVCRSQQNKMQHSCPHGCCYCNHIDLILTWLPLISGKPKRRPTTKRMYWRGLLQKYQG